MVGSYATVLESLPVMPPLIISNSIVKLAGAGLGFNVQGQVGSVLNLQVSPDLQTWTLLLTRTNTAGTVSIMDPGLEQPQCFYRAVQGP